MRIGYRRQAAGAQPEAGSSPGPNPWRPQDPYAGNPPGRRARRRRPPQPFPTQCGLPDRPDRRSGAARALPRPALLAGPAPHRDRLGRRHHADAVRLGPPGLRGRRSRRTAAAGRGPAAAVAAGRAVPLAGGRLRTAWLPSFAQVVGATSVIATALEFVRTSWAGQVLNVDDMLLGVIGAGLLHLRWCPRARTAACAPLRRAHAGRFGPPARPPQPPSRPPHRCSPSRCPAARGSARRGRRAWSSPAEAESRAPGRP